MFPVDKALNISIVIAELGIRWNQIVSKESSSTSDIIIEEDRNRSREKERERGAVPGHHRILSLTEDFDFIEIWLTGMI